MDAAHKAEQEAERARATYEAAVQHARAQRGSAALPAPMSKVVAAASAAVSSAHDALMRAREAAVRASTAAKQALEDLNKSMVDMRLMARHDFTSIVRALCLTGSVPLSLPSQVPCRVWAQIVKLSLARTHFPFVATFVLGLAFAAFFIETVKLGSRQEPIFTTEDVLAMRMEVRQTHTHTRARIHSTA